MKGEPLSTEPYKGVRDYYPADWSQLNAVFNTVRNTLSLYGFEEYQASPLESAALYESKTSEEIVNEQTYTFTDRGDRRVTLRPEMTPTLARMIAAKRRELPFPVRWFSIGNRFRYERPQKGRQREFYQIDVDIIGIQGPKAEGESVVMAYEVLKALGAKNEDFTMRINSRTLLNASCEALKLSEEQTKEYIGLLDRMNKMTPEAFEEKRSAFRRGEDNLDPLALIESKTDETVTAEYKKLEGLIEAFKARGMTNVVLDVSVVRGFLYYTGIVFEVFDTNPENPRALLGGGRYDGLVALFGGDPIPAVGFAIGVSTLMDFLETHALLPKSSSAPQVFVGTPNETDIGAAQKFAETLREGGVRTLVNVTDKSMGDQIKDAVRRGIPYFIAFGEQEAASNTVRLKQLETGTETEGAVKSIIDHIQN